MNWDVLIGHYQDTLILIERKQILDDVVSESKSKRLLYVDFVIDEGVQLYEMICTRDMEGVVAKPKQSQYKLLTGEKTTWIKIKNPEYTQAKGRSELFNQRK